MGVDVAELRAYAHRVGRRVDDGKVIPFLGAGANLCDRPEGVDWQAGRYLPSASELARFLAGVFDYPGDHGDDLVRVAQYVDLVNLGDGALFDELHPLFTASSQPNRLHDFLARLPAEQRAAGARGTYQLIVTTNYDDMLERAFAEAGEPVDVVYYAASEGEPGRFIHLGADGERHPIPRHTDYAGLDLEQRSVILKIHGAVDRSDESGDSYVITEDHYIDYLAHGNVAKLIPAHLMARMTNSQFLFLGYGMRDWNLRVILRHIWAQQVRRRGSWAIQLEPDPIDVGFWRRNNVEIIEARLEDWVDAMSQRRD